MKTTAFGGTRFKMLTRWLTFTAFLAGSANPGRAASGQSTLTFAPSCRIRSHPEVELTLNCGDGKSTGVVQYWHTPFGGLQTPGSQTKLDPVFMHHDGTLVIPNSSDLHSGLYYCLLEHIEGTTLWPYELHVDHNGQENYGAEQSNGCAALRFRRTAGVAEEKHAGVSGGQFAGALVASVLLTFVVGFCAGALSRTYVLRCLRTIAMKLQSRKQQQRQSDTPDHSSQFTMTTMCNNQSFEAEEVMHNDSSDITTTETISSTTASPPAKPQRSFRHKRVEEQEATAYLEGCDSSTEERTEREGEAGRDVEEMTGCDGEANEGEQRDLSGVYLLEDAGSQTETDEDKCSEGREENDEESREEQMDWRLEEEVASEEENTSKDDGEIRRSEKDEEQTTGEFIETKICREAEESPTETSDDESSSKTEDTMRSGITEEPPSAPPRGRRSRVIRLYQYDEDGQRYCHLPDAAPEGPEPIPRLKQRSLSLTRLNAIMAAASAGPMDQREEEGESSEERPQFHMEI